MEKVQFRKTINASRDKVWQTLWEDKTYRQWTSAFSESSYAVTDWKTGSKVLFLDGRGSGMVSRIAENRAPEYMSIEHLGEVHDGVEDITSDRVKVWAGAHEDYTLTSNGNETEVMVEMDMNDEMKGYFMNTWPKALDKLKEIAEN